MKNGGEGVGEEKEGGCGNVCCVLSCITLKSQANEKRWRREREFRENAEYEGFSRAYLLFIWSLLLYLAQSPFLYLELHLLFFSFISESVNRIRGL